ncbi:alanine racemase [Simkania negevensis]|uniref:Alanine racemase n=1 Tax=Simkania negevensis TaxID=83561 RepID=A0ABS3ART6_9BACT|nr:alanine racemase [Simkania negevensis]
MTLKEAEIGNLGNNILRIDLDAIAANLSTIKGTLPDNARVMIMLKALGYGTDSKIVARFLTQHGIDIIGVACVEEGVVLRQSGIRQEIFTLNATHYETQQLIDHDMHVGVSDVGLIDALCNECKRQGKKTKVHLHVDTGMSRLGCRPEEALPLAKQIQQAKELIFEGLFTHFACADNPAEDHFTMGQAATFDKVVDELASNNIHPPWKHACNSAASIRFSFPHYNLYRIGLALFGVHPSPTTRTAITLHPATTLTSRIVGINHCKKGDTISYHRQYKVSREEERIAVIPIGYADGLHQRYSKKGKVIIRGRSASIVGVTCMDYTMVNITDIPEASIGDEVLIFGKDAHGNLLPPETFAARGGTSVYELVSCVGPRINRLFISKT